LPGSRFLGTCPQFVFLFFFADKPLPPGSRAAGYISVNFHIENIFFVKNGNKKYKNKKTAMMDAQ